MFHYLPGQHHHVAEWHNEVHRLEIQGAVPHVFYSQDFVAPPAYVADREHAGLAMQGGEYLSLYWSDGPLDQLLADSRKASQDRRNAGSYHPFQDVVWGARLEAISMHGRSELGYDVNAAPLVPNRGLILVVEQLENATEFDQHQQWLVETWVPRILNLGPLSACFNFVQRDARGIQSVQFWFVDRSDPLQALAAMRATDAEQEVRRIFRGAYQPVITGQYDIYTQDAP